MEYEEWDLAEAVARGATWLDTQSPDWFSRITEPLDMVSAEKCVAGQVFGTPGNPGYVVMYDMARKQNMPGIRRSWGEGRPDVYLGFTHIAGIAQPGTEAMGWVGPYNQHNPMADERLMALRDAWHAAIEARGGNPPAKL